MMLHNKVDLKVQRSLKRFYREAQTSATIGHPAIINIFDVGHAPWGEPNLVMESTSVNGRVITRSLIPPGPD